METDNASKRYHFPGDNILVDSHTKMATVPRREMEGSKRGQRNELLKQLESKDLHLGRIVPMLDLQKTMADIESRVLPTCRPSARV